MALTLPISLKSGSLLLGIAGTAAGLNLSVMSIGAQTPDSDQSAAPTTITADEPELRQVMVDVPVPMSAVDQGSAIPASMAAAPPDTSPAASPATALQGPGPTAPPTQPATPVTSASPQPAPAVAPGPAPPAAPPTTPPTSAMPTTNTTAAAQSTEYLTYQFEGVAEIVVAYHDGQALEFWSATPSSGWAYLVEEDTADFVEIKFRRVSGQEGEAKFELRRRNGELTVRTER